MKKLTASQLTVLTTIKNTKKATKKDALAGGGYPAALTALVTNELVSVKTNGPKAVAIYSVTPLGNGVLKEVNKAAAKAAKVVAKCESKAPAKVVAKCESKAPAKVVATTAAVVSTPQAVKKSTKVSKQVAKA
jgi:hypothetical protein